MATDWPVSWFWAKSASPLPTASRRTLWEPPGRNPAVASVSTAGLGTDPPSVLMDRLFHADRYLPRGRHRLWAGRPAAIWMVMATIGVYFPQPTISGSAASMTVSLAAQPSFHASVSRVAR